MLEKLPGNISVLKLQVILLLEADFNALHKIIFNLVNPSLIRKTETYS